MPVIVPQTESTLLSYFQTGDTPTQNQFEELIRTLFYMAQQATEAAETATTVSAAAAPLAAKVVASLSVSTYAAGTVAGQATIKTQGATISATGTVSSFFLVTVTFTTVFADANYVVSALCSNGEPVSINSRAAGSLVLKVPGVAFSTSEIHVLIFRP